MREDQFFQKASELARTGVLGQFLDCALTPIRVGAFVGSRLTKQGTPMRLCLGVLWDPDLRTP